MIKRLLILFSCVSLLLTGCRKTEFTTSHSSNELVSPDFTTNLSPAKGTVSSEHWKGYYRNMLDGNGVELPGDDPDAYVADADFIHNGVASLPFIQSSSVSSYTSSVEFTIPDSYHISGDSAVLETSVQNLRSNGISDYDVVLKITGAQHSVQVHFVADSSFVSQTEYTLGTISKTGLSSLVHYFGAFQKIKLVTKKGQTAVYINNKSLYHFAYKGDNKIGDVYQISLSGKGSPSFDYIKLTNSVTNKKIMTEDFNIDGQSHTIFY